MTTQIIFRKLVSVYCRNFSDYEAEPSGMGSISGMPYPRWGLVYTLPQQQVELGGMVLHMPHIIQQYFQDRIAHGAGLIGPMTARHFFCQAVDQFPAFGPAKFQILQQFFLVYVRSGNFPSSNSERVNGCGGANPFGGRVR